MAKIVSQIETTTKSLTTIINDSSVTEDSVFKTIVSQVGIKSVQVKL